MRPPFSTVTLLLLVLSAAVSSAQSTSFFVNGTFAGDTRFDVKKLVDGNDDAMCWAAAASNVIDFWQMRNIGHLPAGVPHGQTQLIYSSDVFYTFVYSFEDSGGLMADGVSWWLNGTFMYHSEYQMRTPPLSNGGYYSSFGWNNGDILRTVGATGKRDDLFTLVSDSVEDGDLMMAGIIHADPGVEAGHAIAVWGYARDDLSGDLTGLWITDSDVSDIGSTLVDILWDEQLERWNMTGDYEDWFVYSITQFSAPAVPEPLYGAFALGAVAFALAAYRRRRSGLAAS